MSLNWSPDWCALIRDARGDAQGDPGRGYSFTLHGLWPQFDLGYPSYCRTTQRNPARAESDAMADITGSSGLAWCEWKKHGRCAGLSAETYVALARRAYGSVTIPDVLAHLNRDVKLPASVVEQAFTDANPGLTPPMITVICDQGMIAEARICPTKDLQFRACGVDTAKDCQMQDAMMQKVR